MTGARGRSGSPSSRAAVLSSSSQNPSKPGLAAIGWRSARRRLPAPLAYHRDIACGAGPLVASAYTVVYLRRRDGLIANRRTFLGQDGVGDAARVDRQAIVVERTTQLAGNLHGKIHPEQRQHLRVPVLLDDVHPIVSRDERGDGVRKRIGAQPQVRRRDACLLAELVAALEQRPVARAEGDQAHARSLDAIDLGLRDEAFRRLELALEPVHVLHVVVGALTVLTAGVVAGSAGKVRWRLGAGQRAIRDPVAVHILVAAPLADPGDGLCVEHLASIYRRLRIR